MKITAILFIILTLFSFELKAQARIIQGKIIAEDFETLPFVQIQINDSLIIGTTDTSGRFKIEILKKTEKLKCSFIGMEPAIINIKNSCDNLEIKMLYSGTYDFISLKKVNKLILKRFKKLPELHQLAYDKGIFITKSACYEQEY